MHFISKQKAANKYQTLLNVTHTDIFIGEKKLMSAICNAIKKRCIHGWIEGETDEQIHEKANLVKC